MSLKIRGNETLLEYGIQNEKSTHRAHVCFDAGYVYVFETVAAQRVLKTKSYPERSVYTSGIETAVGLLVPPEDIIGCRWVAIPQDILNITRTKINTTSSTGTKGDIAAGVVYQMILLNLFPFFSGTPDYIDDFVLQIKGIDITVTFNIQVKCDLRGGHKEFGGTGNLFLQVAECNPFKQYTENGEW